MRIVRNKLFRKTLRFFRLVYRLSPPYKVLMDAKFIQGACSVHVDLFEALAHIFDTSPFSLWMTECTKAEIEAAGLTPAISALFRHVKVLSCGHKLVPDEEADIVPKTESKELAKEDRGSDSESGSDSDDDDDSSDDEPARPSAASKLQTKTPPARPFRRLTSAKCISKVLQSSIGSQSHCIAANDQNLRVIARSLSGVPVIVLNRTVVTLEAASAASRDRSTAIEAAKTTVTSAEKGMVHAVKKAMQASGMSAGANVVGITPASTSAGAGAAAEEPVKKKKKRHGPKQPNPLSVKKRKAPTAAPAATTQPQKKHRRKTKSKPASAGDTTHDE